VTGRKALSPPWRWIARFGCLVVLLPGCATRRLSAPGRDIFSGEQPAAARIRGHEASLPAELAACRNCHAAAGVKAAAGSYAPDLGAAWLLEPRERRGGPPSSYDVGSFCRLLRTGVDPAFILVSRVMPTYDLDDARCSNLWMFLTAHQE
jgi:hypothetical protein